MSETSLKKELEAWRERALVRRDHARAKLITAERELSELDAAIAALARTSWRALSPRYEGRITIKQMALEILRLYPTGAPTAEILRMIRSNFSVEIVRTSLAPQLSRLTADGLVERRGKNWFRVPAEPEAPLVMPNIRDAFIRDTDQLPVSCEEKFDA